VCFETDWTPIRELLTKGGEKVTEADVVEVEGRAAFVRVYYTSEEATILYYLADPKAAGFHKDRGNAPSGPMSDEQKEERKTLIANNKGWASVLLTELRRPRTAESRKGRQYGRGTSNSA